MWKRPQIKPDTLEKYKVYARENGMKLWKVFDNAIDSLNKTKGDAK
jgi:hypothetical protein